MNKIETMKLQDYRERKQFGRPLTSAETWHLAQLEARAAKEELERPKKLKQASFV